MMQHMEVPSLYYIEHGPKFTVALKVHVHFDLLLLSTKSAVTIGKGRWRFEPAQTL
jgi:hypothetical protein